MLAIYCILWFVGGGLECMYLKVICKKTALSKIQISNIYKLWETPEKL
jgi:hypothetical protein